MRMRLVKLLIPLYQAKILCNVSNPLCRLKCRSATLNSFAKQFVFISQQPIISAFEDRMTILCVTRKSPVLKEKLPFILLLQVRRLTPSKTRLPICFSFGKTLHIKSYIFGWFLINLAVVVGFSETIWPWNELNCFLILTLTQCSPSSLSLYLFLSVLFPLLDSPPRCVLSLSLSSTLPL